MFPHVSHLCTYTSIFHWPHRELESVQLLGILGAEAILFLSKKVGFFASRCSWCVLEISLVELKFVSLYFLIIDLSLPSRAMQNKSSYLFHLTGFWISEESSHVFPLPSFGKLNHSQFPHLFLIWHGFLVVPSIFPPPPILISNDEHVWASESSKIWYLRVNSTLQASLHAEIVREL